MMEFKAQAWYRLPGRGWIATVSAVCVVDRTNAVRDIRAAGFTIDGESFDLLGVECFQPASPIHIGEHVGLLVKDKSEEPK
jgi:hypothetical protein